MSTRSDIEFKAAALIREAGVEDQLPVPLEKIATYLGFTPLGFTPRSESGDTAKVSGMIDYKGRRILVNLLESLPRQRFTLAHELGHAYLHQDGPAAIVDYRAELDEPTTPREREANQFAAALLMPRKDFIFQWIKLKGDVEQLSRVFGASKTAIEYRAGNTVNACV